MGPKWFSPRQEAIDVPPQAVVFDLFGVLCCEIAPTWLSRMIGPEGHRVKADIVERADLNLISEDEMFETLGAKVGMDGDSVRREWMRLAREVPGSKRLVEAARNGHKVGLLSNAPSRFAADVLQDLDLTQYFDATYVSGVEGVGKPDPQAYWTIARRLGVPPQRTLFIDDNPTNVDGAEVIQMVCHLFRGSEECERWMVSRGIRFTR